MAKPTKILPEVFSPESMNTNREPGKRCPLIVKTVETADQMKLQKENNDTVNMTLEFKVDPETGEIFIVPIYH